MYVLHFHPFRLPSPPICCRLPSFSYVRALYSWTFGLLVVLLIFGLLFCSVLFLFVRPTFVVACAAFCKTVIVVSVLWDILLFVFVFCFFAVCLFVFTLIILKLGFPVFQWWCSNGGKWSWIGHKLNSKLGRKFYMVVSWPTLGLRGKDLTTMILHRGNFNFRIGVGGGTF